jgi:hypothetical protein
MTSDKENCALIWLLRFLSFTLFKLLYQQNRNNEIKKKILLKMRNILYLNSCISETYLCISLNLKLYDFFFLGIVTVKVSFHDVFKKKEKIAFEYAWV